jgi:hypothetical protein
MLTSIGDKMGEGGPAVVEAFGAITTDLHGNFTTAKDAILVDVQTAFLVPFKKAFDEADPTAVFNKAIIDGNLAIIRDFENTLESNKPLMQKIAGSLDPAIKKYIELKAAADAAADAMANAGGETGGAASTTRTNPMGFRSVDTYLASIAASKRAILPTTIIRENAAAAKINTARLTARQSFETGGYIPAPESQGVPALLHGGEYVLNAKAVKRIGVFALEKINNNMMPKFKKGGYVSGTGSVNNTPSFKKGGYVPKMNSMPVPLIFNGGISAIRNINNAKFTAPSGSPSYSGSGQTSSVSTVNINVDTFIGEEEWFKGMMKDYNINILPRMQKNAGNETRSFTTYNGINQGM